MLKSTYKGYSIYFFKEKYRILAEEIIDKKYRIKETYKNDNRSLVLKIELKSENYILKSPINEGKRFLKRIKTLIKKSEVLRTLENINSLRNKGLKELYTPYLAIEKRKYGLIEESYVLTEYIDGKIIKKFTDFSDNEKKELVKTLEK
ncbi:MAG: lipopolysaccharide core heptose(II) kinase RfaY, partial [Fusobacteriaceae bacterium]